MQNMGINTSEMEIAELAGTDENGTLMYGLQHAAQVKGLNTIGMKLSLDDLKTNNVVYLNIDGTFHYSVVREVSKGDVSLEDP